MSRGYLAKCSSGGRPKKSFPTQRAAEAARMSMIEQGKWTAQRSNTYFCPNCCGFHVGSIGASNRGRGKKNRKNPPRLFVQ